MKTPKMTEQQAAVLVVDYLTDIGLDVYQEVGIGGVVADIVAVRDGKDVWIIEVKTSWSLDLLEQLRHHRIHGHANRVFAAVPQSRGDRDRQRLFLDCGFGSICIRENKEWGQATCVEEMAPRITNRQRKSVLHTLSILDEGHKTHAKAGAPCAKGRWTPFRRTCDALEEEVKKNPGVSIKEAMSKIKHHYSSDACARTSMAKWVGAGKISGIKAVHIGGRVALYPSDYQFQNAQSPLEFCSIGGVA